MFRQRKRCYDVTLSRQEGSTTRHLASAQSKDRLAGGDTGRLFLTFGGPVSPTGVSNCPLDRVLTYKNLIYLLNLQISTHIIGIVKCYIQKYLQKCPMGQKLGNYVYVYMRGCVH